MCCFFDFSYYLPRLAAFLIGVLVGFTELLSKYGWGFGDISRSRDGWIYNFVSGIGSAISYHFVDTFGVLADLKVSGEFWRVLIASIIGVAVFRSSFANLNVDGKEFSAGLGGVLDVFKQRAARSLDQRIQTKQIELVAPLVKDLSFEAVKDYLILLSCESLRTLSAAEKDAFAKAVDRISNVTAPGDAKMQFFGLILLQLTGESLFKYLVSNAKQQLSEASRIQKSTEQNKLKKLSELKSKLS